MFKRIKHELSLIRKAFFMYRRGLKYLWLRFVIAPKIQNAKVLGRESDREDLSMHILCGARDFVMCLWSLGSFYKYMPEVGKLYVHDDSSLTEKQKRIYKTKFPGVEIVPSSLDTSKLLKDYPNLLEFRKEFKAFQARKLFDPLTVSNTPWLLILDSDILWFQEPIELIEAVRKDSPRAYMMKEVLPEGADKPHVVFKDGSKTSDEHASYNSGITLFAREEFDLALVDEYVNRAEYTETDFSDQACYAYALGFPQQLPTDRYALKGSVENGLVARHYTGPSRAKVYVYGIEFLLDLLR